MDRFRLASEAPEFALLAMKRGLPPYTGKPACVKK
jgi:hypothetical protein